MSCKHCRSSDDDGCLFWIITILVALFAHSCGYNKGYKEGSEHFKQNVRLLENVNEQK